MFEGWLKDDVQCACTVPKRLVISKKFVCCHLENNWKKEQVPDQDRICDPVLRIRGSGSAWKRYKTPEYKTVCTKDIYIILYRCWSTVCPEHVLSTINKDLGRMCYWEESHFMLEFWPKNPARNVALFRDKLRPSIYHNSASWYTQYIHILLVCTGE